MQQSPSKSNQLDEKQLSVQQSSPLSGKRIQLSNEDFQVHLGICQIMKSIIKGQKELEIARQDLALCPDFDIKLLVKMIDDQSIGLVPTIQFEDWLNEELQMFPDPHQMRLFIRRFDQDYDGRLGFNDILDIFMPLQKEYFNLNSTKKRSNDDTNFSHSTWKLIIQLLNKIFLCETVVDDQLYMLHQNYEIDLLTQFGIFDQQGSTFVTSNQIRYILNRQGTKVTEKEISYLMNLIDHEKNGFINFNNFAKILSPLIR